MAYRIAYDPDAVEHLRALTARNRAIVFAAIERRLAHQPNIPTRNRKLLRPNEVAPWELRVGAFRVYYEIAEEPEQVVNIRAVGVKRGNRVFVAGKEFRL